MTFEAADVISWQKIHCNGLVPPHLVTVYWFRGQKVEIMWLSNVLPAWICILRRMPGFSNCSE